jgi:hypothetical protein
MTFPSPASSRTATRPRSDRASRSAREASAFCIETRTETLRPGELVHHVNGDPTDNRPENLELHDRASHCHEHRRVDRERVKELYAEGLSTHMIAWEMGISSAHASLILREAGLVRTKLEAAALRKLRERGTPLDATS